MKSLINGSRNFALSFLVTLATIFTAQAADKVTYYHNDALGSPVAATNQLGQVIWRETYKPYGQRTTNAPASANNKTWFTGKQEESALGINYFGARWYHPVAGRFLIFDPAGVSPENIHSFNRYEYANNNPYANVDPDGNEVVSASAKNNVVLEKMINARASGIFKFDSQNKLQMVNSSSQSGHSDYYRDGLSSAIASSNTITLDIATKFTDPNGKTYNVDSVGGGLTSGPSSGPSAGTSGKPGRPPADPAGDRTG